MVHPADDRQALIFSDVDGTLIDDFGGNAFEPCRAAAMWAHVILASSRTVVELARMQEQIGITGPVLAENGAVVAVPRDYALLDELPGRREDVIILDRAWRVGHLAPGFDALHARLKHLAAPDRDLVAKAITAAKSSLDREAKARWHSVLLAMPSGPESERLISVFRGAGLRAEPGGHWMQLVSDADKGQAAEALTAAWAVQHRQPWTLAIGDESNDTSLFAAVDRAFVIRRPGLGHHPALMAIPHAEPLEDEGIGGWSEMLARLTAERRAPRSATRSA